MHIHTVFSDGTGSIADVVAAGQAAGLRWVIVTDHDTLGGRTQAGWYDDLLLLVGHEITPLHSHFLALELDYVVSKDKPVQDFVDEVYAQGGFGIMAHPDDHLPPNMRGIHPWGDWSIDGPRERGGQTVGIELWNVMSDWRSNVNTATKTEYYEHPERGLRGPTQAVLEWWDRLNSAGHRTFGIGGLDAHALAARHNGKPYTLFPYEWMMQTVTNYLLLDEPLAADTASAYQQVYAALRQGRSYLVNRLEGALPAPPLYAMRDAQQWHIGASPSLEGGTLTLHAEVRGGDLRLIHNGDLLASGADSVQQTVDSPGVYRLEAQREGRPWLYTNPLYVTA
jgi:hypothetical protein